ncbi:DNA-3-methyladenine glycosylase I [Marinomonas piezotolerans]|uniref:DNA-3-methyladenine glycosylase I n=1 Tax=Marinomonas piezotolerans TaxID=2213058 RepID=A0A370U921_9GAMM|nr:DNA-3-methyladenine glycosylase I [Marinomonas piezotolerans]RDL44233.1 DNA-3-methyladenine glycosylase I [Marinomonas piezotolerans]
MAEHRCDWCLGSPEYIAYHDQEWGKPVFDDQTLFEFIVLESAQAGLSWITVLRKRDGYRRAFHEFDPAKVAAMTADDVDRLVQDVSIIRHRGKIAATISNAKCFLKIAAEYGSFSKYYWSFVKQQPIINQPKAIADVPSVTPLATRISKDMKKRGFKFFGPTICYAFMQSTGMVDDHLTNCIAKNHVMQGEK